MTPMTVLLLGLQASIWLLLISLGLRTAPEDLTLLIRRPGLLARSMAALFVVPPAAAILLDLALPIATPVRFALVALAVSPVPPGLPRKQAKAGGRTDYVPALLATAALVSVVATPLLVALASALLGVPAQVPPAQVAKIVLVSILLPLAAGLGFRQIAPRAAPAASRLSGQVGFGLLSLGIVLLVVVGWPKIAPLVGHEALAAIAAMVIVSLAAGHLLGAGREEVSSSLALAAAARHPGVAMAIASASFPGQNATLAGGVLLFLLMSAVLSAPYVWWMGRRAARAAPRTARA